MKLGGKFLSLLTILTLITGCTTPTENNSDDNSDEIEEVEYNENGQAYLPSEQFGFIKSITNKAGEEVFNIDFAQWLTGRNAQGNHFELKTYVECSPIESCPTEFIRNDSEKVFEMVEGENLEILIFSPYSLEADNPRTIDLEEFKKLLTNDESIQKIPFHITLKQDKVVKLEEQELTQISL